MKTKYIELPRETDVAVIKLANGKQLRVHQSLSGKFTVRSLTGKLAIFPQGAVNTIEVDVIEFNTKFGDK